jgi:hypothetical protein
MAARALGREYQAPVTVMTMIHIEWMGYGSPLRRRVLAKNMRR